MIEIPLTDSPEQIFNITINDEVYDVRVIWNTRIEQWSISFEQEGVGVLTGIALAGGVDIFSQYTVALQNGFVVNLENARLDPPLEGLGTTSKLFLLTDDEVLL